MVACQQPLIAPHTHPAIQSCNLEVSCKLVSKQNASTDSRQVARGHTFVHDRGEGMNYHSQETTPKSRGEL